MNPKHHISVCFLVLHYMNIKLTSMTIESIMQLNHFGNSKIVVVDNASPNGSGKVLEKKYKNISEVHIIHAETNNGFSVGNNIGFQYIKNNYISDFIIAANNDVLFPQRDFIDRLYVLYAEDSFWVAGPDIYEPHREYHSSPMYEHLLNTEEIGRVMKETEQEKQKLEKIFSFYGFKIYIRDSFRDNKIINFFIRLNRFVRGQKRKYWERCRGIVLQGACLIFDKRFCENNSELFSPLTFMYGEELLLAKRCEKNNWEIKYFPELFIWHFSRGSSQSMKLSYREYCKKRIIELERIQEAYRIYAEQL